MNKQAILELIGYHICEVIPALKGYGFKPNDRLIDLGANSMDRADILTMTMEGLSLQIPRAELFGAKNIGELADMFFEKLQST